MSRTQIPLGVPGCNVLTHPAATPSSPRNGVVIAFRTDNPGALMLHGWGDRNGKMKRGEGGLGDDYCFSRRKIIDVI